MPNAAMNLSRRDPEVQRINEARAKEGMAPIPDDVELDAALREAGFETCWGKRYWWAKKEVGME
jgi:hypothetical protein